MDDRERFFEIVRSSSPLYERAIEIADREGHTTAGVVHLAAALVERPEVERAIRACRIDVEEITELVGGMLADERRRRWWHVLPVGASAELSSVIDHAIGHAFGAQLDAVGPVFVLVRLLVHEPRSLTAERLDAVGVEPLPLMRYDAHGSPHETVLPEGSGPVVVVVHNDPYTPFELVTELFATFGLSREDAEREMLAVHHGGSASFRFREWEVGRARAEAARRRASERGFPLTFSLERG